MTFELTATFEQTPGSEVSQMPDGVVVYQTARERVHYLNPTASLVYDLCGGTESMGAISAYLQDAFSLSAPPSDEVSQCLIQLLSEGLIAQC